MIYPLPQCLWLLNSTERGYTMSSLLLWSHKAFWPSNLAVSREILDLLYLCYHMAYDHQILQVANLLWKALNHMFNNPFNAWSCEVNWSIKSIISSLSQCLLPHNLTWGLLIMRSFLCFFNHVALGFWFSLMRFVGLERKRLSRHRLLVILCCRIKKLFSYDICSHACETYDKSF